MKSFLIVTVAWIGLASAAVAQPATGTASSPGQGVPVGGSGANVSTGDAATTKSSGTIPADARAKLKQYTETRKVTAAQAPSGFVVRQGGTLPEAMQLSSIPSEVGVSGYQYAVVANQSVNQIHIVDPASRRIVEIVE